MSTAHPLLEAIKAGDVERVTTLIDADPALVNTRDDSGASAILVATYYGRKSIVDSLLAYEPVLDLFEASAVGDLDRVSALLNEDPDLTAEMVNTFSHDGFTPLGLAAFFGHEDVAEYLLSKGAQVSLASQNRMRVMPLHSAVAGRHLGISKTLLEHGADVNAAQQDGFAPLHGAAQNGQLEMVELLLSYGADVNARNIDGQTPLAIALKEGHVEAAESFREHGAA